MRQQRNWTQIGFIISAIISFIIGCILFYISWNIIQTLLTLIGWRMASDPWTQIWQIIVVLPILISFITQYATIGIVVFIGWNVCFIVSIICAVLAITSKPKKRARGRPRKRK